MTISAFIIDDEKLIATPEILRPENMLGVFESFMAERSLREEKIGYKIVGLTQHLSRLNSGAELLGLSPVNPAKVKHFIGSALARLENPNLAIVRIIVLKDKKYLTFEVANSQFENKPVALLPFFAQRELPEVKNCTALISRLSSKKAVETGFDEALLIDGEIVREGSWSNFFWIDKGDILRTPFSRILQGVTRSEVIRIARQDFEVQEVDTTLQEVLQNIKEAFITSSLRGVVPVVRIGDRELQPGKITSILSNRYRLNAAYEEVDLNL